MIKVRPHSRVRVPRQNYTQGSAEIIAVLGLVAVIGITVGMVTVSIQSTYKRAISSLNQTQSFYATETAGRAKLFQTLGVPPTVTTAMQMGPSLWENAYYTPPSDFVIGAGFSLFSASTLSAFLPSDAWGSEIRSNPAGSSNRGTTQVLNLTGGSGGAPSSENILSHSTQIVGSGKAPSSYVRTLASGTKEYCGTQQFSSSGKTYQTCVLFTSGGQCVESTDLTVATTIQGGGYFSPKGSTILEKMNANIRANNLPYAELSEAFDGVATPSMFLRSHDGVEDTATLTQVCNGLGYREYVSSVCTGPDGCNYRSPGNNTMLKYDPVAKSWINVAAAPKASNTFLYGITCKGKKLCYGTTIAPSPSPSPTTGKWYQAIGQDCGTFCSGKGLQNVQSPDSFDRTATINGVTYPMTGSWCTSGEVIPPSASEARIAGTLNYQYGCWPECTQGAFVKAGRSVGVRCYGTTGWGAQGPQKQDNDATDTTVGCYCQ